MVKYKTIIQIINNYCEKTHLTIQQNKQRLQNWTIEEKKTLLKYGVSNYNEKEYDNILKNGTEEEIWEYERQIIDNLTKGRQDNIIKYLTDFHEEDYLLSEYNDEVTAQKGKSEQLQIDLQEKKGYTDEETEAISDWYADCGYIDMADWMLYKESHTSKEIEEMKDILNNYTPKEYHEKFGGMIKYKKWAMESCETLENYMENNVPMQEDSVLFRVGSFYDNLQVGSIGEIPTFSSTSYHERVIDNIKEDMGESINSWDIQIYAPKGTKGVVIDTPTLLDYDPQGEPQSYQHEFTLAPHQKYIVLSRDEKTHKAVIKLLPN